MKTLQSSPSGRKQLGRPEDECAELHSLQQLYTEASNEFTKTAKKLRAAPDAPPTEYALLSRLAQRAKVEAETARRALRQHIIAHGCC